MDIVINKNVKTPIYKQIALGIKTKILNKEINDGYTLLSERALAKQLGVHRNTIVKAYNELEADGFVTARQGKGYSVSYEELLLDEDCSKNNKIRNVNWENLIKEENLIMENTFDELFFKSYSENCISLAGGMATADIYSMQDILGSIEVIMKKNRKSANFYTHYQGDLGLRKQLAEFMREKGVLLSASDIQVFSEMNQAIDFIFSLLLKPGDTVIIEEPISPDVHRALSLAGVVQLTVPMDTQGMICDNLGPLIEKHRPKLIYVNSSYQDPTGNVLSVQRRKKLLSYSYKYRIPIIEEDAASLLDFDGKKIPSIKSMDKADNVIYVYSFSLTLIPGISVAFVAAPKTLIKSLRHLVSVRLINVGWIPQKLLEHYLKEGIYKESLSRIKQFYKHKMEIMYNAIQNAEIKGFYCTKPRGGVYIWCHIPEYIDIKKLTKEALKRGLNFIPSYVFYTKGSAYANYIRLNYSAPSVEEIEKGMGILIDTIHSFE